MKPPSGSKKTNPIKPNFFKGQNELKIACRKNWLEKAKKVVKSEQYYNMIGSQAYRSLVEY
jgi:hypothetical protein